LRSVHEPAFLDEPVKPAVLSHNVLLAEETLLLALQRLQALRASAQDTACESSFLGDHVLPLSTERMGSKTAGRRAGAAAHGIALSSRGDATEEAQDPLIERLSDALAAAERGCDQHSRIYADAVQLAIVVRLLGQQSAPSAEPVEKAGNGRHIRALQKWRLRRVLEHIEVHLSDKITLADLAAVAGLSRMHFASQFRAAMGQRPHEYLLRQRIRRADQLLRRSTMPIVEIALTVGFQTQAHFTTVFKRFMGHTPCGWRNAHHVDGLAAI